MWVFTGGCHYDEYCGAYVNECGKCKVLKSNKKNDLSKRIFNRKQKAFQKIQNLTIIGLSKWLENCARNSNLFRKKNVVNFPNPIDTATFRPFNKNQSRDLWHLSQDKKLVLFGAMGIASDPRKGFKELSKALLTVKFLDLELVVFGSSQPENPPDFGFRTHYLGFLNDEVSLVTLYSAVDVMVVPSLQENLSNTIMESLSCSTPVVGFDIGGNSDMIEHKKTGYLSKAFDTDDLANGIDWVLNTPDYEQLCNNARQKVLKEFDSKVVAKKYIKLYQAIYSALLLLNFVFFGMLFVSC